MANKYLEKMAALNPVAKKFALRVAGSVAGDSTKINSVYNATSGVVSKRFAGALTTAEQTAVKGKMGEQAAKAVGPGRLYPHEATRAARAGAMLDRIQSTKLKA